MVQVMACARMWIGVLLGMTLLAAAGSAMSVEDAELEAQFSEGMDALNDNRLKSAIRAFSRILDREPALHRARLELALAYYRSMRYQDAEKLPRLPVPAVWFLGQKAALELPGMQDLEQHEAGTGFRRGVALVRAKPGRPCTSSQK